MFFITPTCVCYFLCRLSNAQLMSCPGVRGQAGTGVARLGLFRPVVCVARDVLAEVVCVAWSRWCGVARRGSLRVGGTQIVRSSHLGGVEWLATGGRLVEAGADGNHVTGGIVLRWLVPWEVVPDFDGSGDERRRVGEPALATFRRKRRTVGLS